MNKKNKNKNGKPPTANHVKISVLFVTLPPENNGGLPRVGVTVSWHSWKHQPSGRVREAIASFFTSGLPLTANWDVHTEISAVTVISALSRRLGMLKAAWAEANARAEEPVDPAELDLHINRMLDLGQSVWADLPEDLPFLDRVAFHNFTEETPYED